MFGKYHSLFQTEQNIIHIPRWLLINYAAPEEYRGNEMLWNFYLPQWFTLPITK